VPEFLLHPQGCDKNYLGAAGLEGRTESPIRR